MRRPKTTQREDGQQLTAMIDVVFLLLIFFICTMNFRVIEGRVDTELPKDEGQNSGVVADLLEPLNIHIANDPSHSTGFAVRVSGRPVDVETIAGIVAGAMALVPEIAVRLSTGASVTYGQVIAVIDEVLEGGVSQVHFAG